MYDTAKKSREALKNKARRLASGSSEKVSSSDWTPPEPLNADVKTGARPVSRRAYKKGGKVEGSCGPMRADRKPRKAGGKAETPKDYANAKINRDVKAANEEREGKKHVGGFKKGGRTEKADGGDVDIASLVGLRPVWKTKPAIGQLADNMKKGGRAKKQGGGILLKDGKPYIPDVTKEAAARSETQLPKGDAIKRAEAHMSQMGKSVATDKGMSADEARKFLEGRKAGGRTDSSVKQAKIFGQKAKGRAKKMMGGPMMGGAMPGGPMMDPRMGIVKDKALDFGGQSFTPGVTPMKKGGRAAHKEGGKVSHMEWEHSKEDLAQDKKLAKKHGMSLEQWEKSEADKKHDKQQSMKGLDKTERTARKSGGRTKSKGKTNIAIVINAGGKDKDQDGDMNAPPIVGSDAMPIPVPPKAAMPAGGMPMPMPMPGGMPGGMPPMPPAGAPPLARKAGGRIAKKASSYKDMEAGAGSGEGRLQKTDIAAKQPKPGLMRGVIADDNKGYPNKVNGATGGRTARKVGGRTYRSYKDMDAGAGSGEGRLEKTEIAARKK